MLALIPARSGSKGLPGKNTRELNGKPLIAYSVEQASAAKNITDILITTDDENIHELFKNHPKARCPFKRPPELSGDTAQARDVYLHALQWLEENENKKVEEFCVLLPTSPLRKAEDIDQAIDLFFAKKADAVVSVTDSKPIAWQRYCDTEGRLQPLFVNESSKEQMKNRQEMHKPVVLNGSIYVFKTAFLKQSLTYFGENTFAYRMPLSRSIDIDSLDDFIVAEALVRRENT